MRVQMLQRGAVLALLLASARARADEVPPAPTVRAPQVWDLSVRTGWGTVLTTGQSYLGPSFGGAVGLHLRRRLRVELGGLYAVGTRVNATNATLAYRSSVDSAELAIGIGYDVEIGPIVLRPGARAGGREVQNRVQVGLARSSEVALYPIVGPTLALARVFGRLVAGLEAEALFVPTWVASPSFGFVGFLGVTL